MSQCVQFRGFRFSFGNISQLGHNKTFFYCYLINMALIYDICHVSKIRHKDFRSFVHPLSVTLRLPPLDSETGWTGELWSNFWIWGFFYELLYFFWIFRFFFGLFTTKSYQGFYWSPKIAKKMGQNSIISYFFCPNKSLIRRPKQELEVGPHSGRIF